MRLHGIREGRIYATDGRDVYVGTAAGNGSDGTAPENDSHRALSGNGPTVTVDRFERRGRLPLPDSSREGALYYALTTDPLRSVTERVLGTVCTTNLWPITDERLLATVGRRLFVSADGGRSWQRGPGLPDSSGPMGVLPSAVTVHEGTVYLGEYPLDDDVTPRVRASADGGQTWSTAARLPDVRHVHAVQTDPYTGDVWVTTGDTDAASRIGRLRDGTVAAVVGGSQRYRAVELAFTPTSVLWGMDCVYADANRIFALSRDALDEPDPEPRSVREVPGSVYYSAALDVDGERWVAFSTALETGADSTGPTAQSTNDPRGTVVAASSASDYTDWTELASYRRRRTLGDRLDGRLPRANGYVFLAADPDGGLFVNPINTAADHGSIERVPLDRFRSLRSTDRAGRAALR